MKTGDEGFMMAGGCEVTPHDRAEIACDSLVKFLRTHGMGDLEVSLCTSICPGVTLYLTCTDAEKLVAFLEKGA